MASGSKMENAQRKIIDFRMKHKLEVKQLAAYLGVNPEAVYRWEKGTNAPQVYMDCALIGVIVKMQAEKIRKQRGEA